MPRRLAVVLAIVALLVSFGPASSFALAAGPGAKPDKCAHRVNNTPRSWCSASGPTICGPTCRLSRRSPTPIRARRPSVAQLRRARLQGVCGLCREADAGKPDTTSRSRRTSSPTSPTSGLPTLSEVSPTAHDYTLVSDWNPGQSTGTPTADLQPAGGIVIPPTPTPSSSSGCTPADFTGFIRADRADPARQCNFGVKVAERPGCRRVRRDHLQRGQPWPHRRVQRQPGGRRGQPDRPDHPGRLHVVRHRRRPLQPVQPGSQAGRPAGDEPRHPRRSSTRTATTTTSSPSPRAATRTTSWSSMRTSTPSTARACSTTPPARRRSSTSPR